MSKDPRSIAVIGAGATGLVAAYRLLQAGQRVHVIDASQAPGGLLRTVEIGGQPVERFYHHIFKTDRAAISLLQELGLGDRLVWRPSSIGVFYDGRTHPFTSPSDLLRFSPLPLGDRVSLGLLGLRLRRERDSSRYDRITAQEWLRRTGGKQTYEVVWEPLLRGKFGDMADQVVMSWLWNRIRIRFNSREGRLSQVEVLGYLTGSFGAWTKAISSRITQMGGRIQTGAKVRQLIPGDKGITMKTDGSPGAAYDAVIATIGGERFLEMSPPVGDSYSTRVKAIPYQDAVCLTLALKQRFSDYYWLNIHDRSVPFLAAVEHTNLVGADLYGGQHILYLSNYTPPGAEPPPRDADEVFRAYLPHLQRINPEFDASWVNEMYLFHGPEAQPVFTVDAAARIPDHRTPVPGLYLANMSQIYPEDRGQNQAILMGERVAEMVQRDLSEGRQAPLYHG